jgi:hypothetical protein
VELAHLFADSKTFADMVPTAPPDEAYFAMLPAIKTAA